jgi:hypothetical protein
MVRSSIIVLLLGCVVVIIGYQAGWFTSELDPDPAPTAAVSLTDEERAYYDYIAPRLRQAAAEASYLADLGEQRSRNILELQQHRDTLSALLSEIGQYSEDHGVPERFTGVDQAFREGAAISTLAMRDAIEVFTSFDFAQFADIVPRFREGADQLALATQRLDELGGGAVSATPSS